MSDPSCFLCFSLDAWSGGLGVERGIVRVAFGSATIERCRLGLVEGRVALEACCEVGVGDEGATEGDQVGFAGLNGPDRLGAVVAVVGEIGALEELAKRGDVGAGRKIAAAP
jgi:hypothetical protein